MLSPQQKVSIEWQCYQIAIRASNSMDKNDVDEFLACHTEDTEFVRPSTFPDGRLIGCQPILDILRLRDTSFVSRHVISNVVVNALSDAQAEGTAYFTHFAGQREIEGGTTALPIKEALVSMGEYRMTFTLIEGTWKIKTRIGKFIFGDIFTA